MWEVDELRNEKLWGIMNNGGWKNGKKWTESQRMNGIL